MPRSPDQPNPLRWKLFDGTEIWRDNTRRRSDGKIDRRSNDSYLMVAKVLGRADGKKLAAFIVDACNRAETSRRS